MDHSVTFARHYARLVWLLLHEAANVDEQKASLRALVTVSKDGAVALTSSGDALWANGTTVPSVLAGVGDVARRMASHGVAEVAFDAGAGAAGVLGSARILAGDAAADDAGVAAQAKLQALGAPGVRFTGRPAEQPAAGATPVAAAPAAAAPAPAPAPPPAPAAAVQAAPPPPAPAPPIVEAGTLPDLGLDDVDVLDEQAIEAKLRPTPRANVAVPAATEQRADSSDGGMFAQFTATRAPTASHAELLAQLDQAEGVSVLTRVLDDLVAVAESAARDARPALVCEILCRVTRCEP